MKIKILFVIVVVAISNLFAQTDSSLITQNINELNSRITILENKSDSLILKEDVAKINSKVNELNDRLKVIEANNKKHLDENVILKNSLTELNKKIKKIKKDFEIEKNKKQLQIDGLQQIISTNSSNIKKTAKELGVKIDDTRRSTNKSISDLDKIISQNTLYWIIAILSVALFVLLVFVFLRKQIFKQRTDLNSNLEKTRKAIEEESVKLDNKLIEVLETQLKIIDNASSEINKEVDHTLALKVADEIIRIQKNLSRMDAKTKGLKQLTASVKRIRDNFVANGYEIVEMLGKPYNEGMKVAANFIPDESLNADEQIITRIIKPQVNFNGVMIQSAQIEVSVGE